MQFLDTSTSYTTLEDAVVLLRIYIERFLIDSLGLLLGRRVVRGWVVIIGRRDGVRMGMGMVMMVEIVLVLVCKVDEVVEVILP